MATAAAMIDKIGSPHPIRCIKFGKYSVLGHSVLRSENFCFQQQADREGLRVRVSRPEPRNFTRNFIRFKNHLYYGNFPIRFGI
jgi:hypothetical protein